MGPGENVLEEIHNAWKANKKITSNVETDILESIISGNLNKAQIIEPHSGGGGILKGIWVSHRQKANKKNIHKVIVYDDVLKKTGFKKDFIVSLFVIDNGTHLAIISSEAIGTKYGYKLLSKTKKSLSLTIEFTNKTLRLIDRRLNIEDIDVREGAILIPWK